MNCETIRLDLKALLDGELGPLAAWRMRRHLARCADCRAEWEALKRLHALLRSADVVEPAHAILDFPLVPARRSKKLLKLAGSALAMVALVAALIISPTWRQSPQNMAASVASALGRVNTWHLSGWKMVDGRRVPWDVWGRRRPYLYYERVGHNITVDDGAQRLRIYPPALALGRPVGLVIRTASEKATLDGFGPSIADMASQWDWQQGGGMFAPRPYRRTAVNVVFRLQYPEGVGYGVNANQLYTINRFTWLPTQYQLQFSTAKFHRDVEELRASYDVDLPDTVAAPPVPSAYSHVDFMGGKGLGLNVHATPLDMDQTGSVLVRVRGYLGGVPVTSGFTSTEGGTSRHPVERVPVTPGPTFTLSVSAADSWPCGIRDGKTAEYLPMDARGYQFTAQNGDVLLWLAPLEPPRDPSSLPDALRLPVSVSVQVQVKATDFVNLQGQPYSRSESESLLTEDRAWTLPLPTKPTVQDIQMSTNWHFQWGNGLWPLDYYLDQARASRYYLNSFGYQADVFRKVAPGLIRQGVLNPDGTPNMAKNIPGDWMQPVYQNHAKAFAAGQQQKRVRAVYWLQREIATLPTTGQGRGWRLITAQQLAKYQQVAGQTAQSKQTLRQMIKDAKSLSGYGLESRQAEYTLRTGIFPVDVGYNGP